MIIKIEKVKAYYDPMVKNSFTHFNSKTVKTFKDIKTAFKYFNSLGVNKHLINIINKKNTSGYVYHLTASDPKMQFKLSNRKTFIKA